MSVCVLNLVVWMFGIRGQIPRGGDYGDGRGDSPLAGRGALIRVLAACVVSAVLLSLVIWAAVWLTLKLL
jgi:hypothetical protein